MQRISVLGEFNRFIFFIKAQNFKALPLLRL